MRENACDRWPPSPTTGIIASMMMLAQIQAAAARAPEVAVPLSTQWMPALLLTIVWIFVAAAVAGALVRFFGKTVPRDS